MFIIFSWLSPEKIWKIQIRQCRHLPLAPLAPLAPLGPHAWGDYRWCHWDPQHWDLPAVPAEVSPPEGLRWWNPDPKFGSQHSLIIPKLQGFIISVSLSDPRPLPAVDRAVDAPRAASRNPPPHAPRVQSPDATVWSRARRRRWTWSSEMSWLLLMWVKQCHKPAMTGNGKHTAYKNGDLRDGLLLFYPHCINM